MYYGDIENTGLLNINQHCVLDQLNSLFSPDSEISKRKKYIYEKEIILPLFI